ncbi:TniB family NTP-binding protein [Acinetobacter baumannii]|uniref:TniB family NTP-binding protein n=1 Tax=Acinetobacter baumannii TaxID=470 RepID=UPI002FBE54E1
MDYSHLTLNTAKKIELSDKERIEYLLKPRWIGYTQSQKILGKLEDLLAFPKQSRMPNLLIVGETNNGKTVLVNKFRDKHPPLDNPNGDAVILPVLYIQAPPGPDERGLYNAILNRLFEPYGKSEATDSKRDRVISVLKKLDLGMIMIDEIQHLLAGPYTKQRACLNTLKYLGNELCVPLVGIGTAEAIRAVQADPQLANRFNPEILPKWKLDQEYLRLLASFEKLIPLKQVSNLPNKELAELILSMSGGTIGEISTLLNMASKFAIKNKIEKITKEVIEESGYIGPHLRKQMAARI